LGLFGLTAYVAERRKKEVAIRKVLGAEDGQLVFMLSGNFIKMALVSFLISAPVSFMVLHRFLEKYAYRVSIEWWVLSATFAFVLLITVVIILIQVMKTVGENPVVFLTED